MKSRLIAALILVSLLWWSIPAAFASSATTLAQDQTTQPSSNTHDHSCCPGAHARFIPPLFVKPGPAPIPCEEHPCCVKHGPENPPSLPGTTSIPRPGSDVLPATTPDQSGCNKIRITADA